MGILHHRSMGKLDIAQEIGKKEYKENILQRFGKFRADNYRPENLRKTNEQYTVVCLLVIPTDKTTTQKIEREKQHINKIKNRKEHRTKQHNK